MSAVSPSVLPPAFPGALRAQIRRDVFVAMEDGGDVCHPTPPENIVLNELVREYLEFNSACHAFFARHHLCIPLTRAHCRRADYRHTLAIFAPEAALPAKPLPRSYVAQQTQLHESSPDLPLLYTLLAPSAPEESLMPPEPEPPAAPPPPSHAAPAVATAPPRLLAAVRLRVNLVEFDG